MNKLKCPFCENEKLNHMYKKQETGNYKIVIVCFKCGMTSEDLEEK